jgi:hypothetical protein
VVEVPRPERLREQAVDGFAVAPSPLDDAFDAPDGLLADARDVGFVVAGEDALEMVPRADTRACPRAGPGRCAAGCGRPRPVGHARAVRTT